MKPQQQVPVPFTTVLFGAILGIYFATIALSDLVMIGLISTDTGRWIDYAIATLIAFFYHRRNTMIERALQTPPDQS